MQKLVLFLIFAGDFVFAGSLPTNIYTPLPGTSLAIESNFYGSDCIAVFELSAEIKRKISKKSI